MTRGRAEITGNRHRIEVFDSSITTWGVRDRETGMILQSGLENMIAHDYARRVQLSIDSGMTLSEAFESTRLVEEGHGH